MNVCSKNEPLYVEVAADVRSADRRTTLTYRLPDIFRSRVRIGQLVWIPLRKKIALGIVVAIHDRQPVNYQIKDIRAPVEPTFCLTPTQWELAAWIAEETVCSFFDAASLMLPPGVGARTVEYLHLAREPSELEREELTRMQRALVELLEERGEIALASARRSLGSSLSTIIPALEERRFIERTARVRTPRKPRKERTYQVRLNSDNPGPPETAPRQFEVYRWLTTRLRARPDHTLPITTVLAADGVSRQTLKALEERGSITIEASPVATPSPVTGLQSNLNLTDEQRAAWEQISGYLQDTRFRRVLLHGVTGSGKTEIYFRAIAAVLATGRSAILLVPEIALAGQVIERARERFGHQAIVLHSSLDAHQRYANWQRATTGEPLLVVGARSALFAPLPGVGVIILDEEHEQAYKQDSPPRYHARTVAERLASLYEALLILGSATPDIESYYQSERHEGIRIVLPRRIGQRSIDPAGQVRPRHIPLPGVHIVDLRSELREGNQSLFSPTLSNLIEDRLRAGEQTILFLNRRGMSTVVQCRMCGAVSQCPYCDVPLVYHRTIQRTICHRCGYRTRPLNHCPICGSASIGYFGAGTQRVEQEIQVTFPKARVLRWDQDALRGGANHDDLLEQVARGRVDIVVGTQMVAKGLDLPNVTAVGVVNADTYLHLPDFRSAERTYQMLSQVAGRAGRRAAGGEVIIQTYSPEHYSVICASRHDYDGFYREEIRFRRQYGYPPFKRLVRLLYRHPKEEEARDAAERLARYIERFLIDHRRHFQGIDMLGPAPAFTARIRGRYGWQLIVRGDNAPRMLSELEVPLGWAVDVDPVHLL